jgi:hypothetical protein
MTGFHALPARQVDEDERERTRWHSTRSTEVTATPRTATGTAVRRGCACHQEGT